MDPVDDQPDYDAPEVEDVELFSGTTELCSAVTQISSTD
jgi:hypothetical protein